MDNKKFNQPNVIQKPKFLCLFLHYLHIIARHFPPRCPEDSWRLGSKIVVYEGDCFLVRQTSLSPSATFSLGKKLLRAKSGEHEGCVQNPRGFPPWQPLRCHGVLSLWNKIFFCRCGRFVAISAFCLLSNWFFPFWRWLYYYPKKQSPSLFQSKNSFRFLWSHFPLSNALVKRRWKKKVSKYLVRDFCHKTPLPSYSIFIHFKVLSRFYLWNIGDID